MKSVYLSGPIAGLTYDEGQSWRGDAAQALAMWGIRPICPMRGQTPIDSRSRITSGACYVPSALTTDRAILTRDRFDATTCDMMLVYLLGATEKSLGTAMEIAYADMKRIPIVAVVEADGRNPHNHPMINESIDFYASSLSEAIDVIKSVLGVKNPLDSYVHGLTTVRAVA